MYKKCTYSGSNRGPLACEANVITNYTTGATVYMRPLSHKYGYAVPYANIIVKISKMSPTPASPQSLILHFDHHVLHPPGHLLELVLVRFHHPLHFLLQLPVHRLNRLQQGLAQSFYQKYNVGIVAQHLVERVRPELMGLGLYLQQFYGCDQLLPSIPYIFLDLLLAVQKGSQ